LDKYCTFYIISRSSHGNNSATVNEKENRLPSLNYLIYLHQLFLDSYSAMVVLIALQLGRQVTHKVTGDDISN